MGDTEVDSDLLDELGAYVVLKLRAIQHDDDDPDSDLQWGCTIISTLGNAVLDEIDVLPGIIFANIVMDFNTH